MNETSPRTVCNRNRDASPSRSSSGSFTDSYLAPIEICGCLLWADESQRRCSPTGRGDQYVWTVRVVKMLWYLYTERIS
jgi:hypothetical protein